MNILFVHEVDWLSKVVFEIHNISEQMSLLGHRVFAVDYENPWKISDLLRPGSWKTQVTANVSRTVEGGSVRLIRPGFIRLPVLSRISAALTHWRAINKIVRDEKIDVIVLYAVPTSGWQTLRIARKYGVPVVFRAIDILHELVPFSPLRPLAAALEKHVYRNVDRIVAVAPRYADYVKSQGAPADRVRLVLMPVDTGLFRPATEPAGLRQRWGLGESNRIVLFIGTLFHFSGLDVFIRHFPEVLAAVPEARLLIVGNGPQRDKLESLIAAMSLRERVTITGFQPYQDMPRYISIADVCINTFLNTRKTEDFFPSKILQYVACGKASVATPLKGITSIIPGQSGGVVYADGNKMAGEVVSLLRDPGRRRQLGENGVAYIEKAHSCQSIARQFEAEIEEVVRERKRPRN